MKKKTVVVPEAGRTPDLEIILQPPATTTGLLRQNGERSSGGVNHDLCDRLIRSQVAVIGAESANLHSSGMDFENKSYFDF